MVVLSVSYLQGCGVDPADARAPAPAPELLTLSDREPAGEHCVHGGTVIRAGLDYNNNGILDNNEVEHTDYLCDVPTTVLVRKDTLAPGFDCPAGGVAIRTGIDDNRNGILENTEIDDTTRVCSSLELWSGDFTAHDWNDPLKVAALKGARVVTGSLAIGTTDLVVLPLLELVTGDLFTDAHDVAAELPALRRVIGALRVTTGSVAPALPALAQVEGNVTIVTGSSPVALPALQQIGGILSLELRSGAVTFDVLEKVRGDLMFSGVATLLHVPRLHTIEGRLATQFWADGRVSLSELQTVGGDMRLLGGITELHLDRLTSIGGGIELELGFNGSTRLDLVLPSLQSIGGNMRAGFDRCITRIELPQVQRLGGNLDLSSSSLLTEISLPAVKDIGGNVFISGEDALVRVDLGALETIGGRFILSGAALRTLSMGALRTVSGGGPSDDDDRGIQIAATAIETCELTSLRSVAGDIVISNNRMLRSIRLPQLTTANVLFFGLSPLLEVVSVPRIATLADVDIFGASLRNLDLGQLTTVTDTISIGETTLPDLAGLRSLSSVGRLVLDDVEQLQDLRGLASLRRLSALSLFSNDGLQSLDGLERVTRLSGFLHVDGNHALTSIAGLRNVTHIGSMVRLERNSTLSDLALTNLTSIDGDLTILEMRGLTSLSGLDALASVGDNIEIARTGLSADEIRAFLERLGQGLRAEETNLATQESRR